MSTKLYNYRPSHCNNSMVGMGDTRSPRLARSRRPEDGPNSFADGENNEVFWNFDFCDTFSYA